jgi:hypothetical protein
MPFPSISQETYSKASQAQFFEIINDNYPIHHKKHIVFNHEAIENTLKTADWFILITNIKYDSQEIYDCYRLKDIIEKSFSSYNNSLGQIECIFIVIK